MKAERSRHALELRKQGFTYEAIGRTLSMSTANAHKTVRLAIEAIPLEAASQVRQLELERLDKMLAALWEEAIKGHPKAVAGVVRIMERRAAYLGLDKQAPGASQTERELAAAEVRISDRLTRLAEVRRAAETGEAQ